MASTLEQRYNGVEAGRGSVQGLLAGLKAKQAGLINRLKSSIRAVFPGANRESSAWRALSAEYGPDEPMTWAFDPDVNSVRLQHYVDHHYR
jgi:hypothetical protein